MRTAGRALFHEGEDLPGINGHPELRQTRRDAVHALLPLSALLAQKGLADPEEAAAAATDFLRLFGLTAYAYLWSRMAELSLGKTEGAEGAFYRGKLATARFFMTRLLPESTALFAQISAGAKTLMALEAEAI